MKLLLVLLVIGGSGYIGYGVSKYYRRRHSFFATFSVFLDKIMADISFSQNKLVEVFSGAQASQDATLKTISKNFVKYLTDKDAELTEILLFENTNILKLEEKNLLFSFFSSLGKHDTDGERIMITSHKEQILRYATTCEKEDKKYSSLSVKIGILLGSMIALLIV